MTSPMEEYTGDLEMESSLFTSRTLACTVTTVVMMITLMMINQHEVSDNRTCISDRMTTLVVMCMVAAAILQQLDSICAGCGHHTSLFAGLNFLSHDKRLVHESTCSRRATGSTPEKGKATAIVSP